MHHHPNQPPHIANALAKGNFGMRKNARINEFLDKLTAAGIGYRVNWASRRDGRLAYGAGGADVYHMTFTGDGFKPSVGTAIIIDYDGDGYGFYPEAPSNLIDNDVAAIATPLVAG